MTLARGSRSARLPPRYAQTTFEALRVAQRIGMARGVSAERARAEEEEGVGGVAEGEEGEDGEVGGEDVRCGARAPGVGRAPRRARARARGRARARARVAASLGRAPTSAVAIDARDDRDRRRPPRIGHLQREQGRREQRADAPRPRCPSPGGTRRRGPGASPAASAMSASRGELRTPLPTRSVTRTARTCQGRVARATKGRAALASAVAEEHERLAPPASRRRGRPRRA